MGDLYLVQPAACPPDEQLARDVLTVLRARRQRIYETPIDPWLRDIQDRALARLRLANGEKTLQALIKFPFLRKELYGN